MESKGDKNNSFEDSVFYKRFLDLFENPETPVIEKALLKVDNDIRRVKENLGIIAVGFVIFPLTSVFIHIDSKVGIIIFLVLIVTSCIHVKLMYSRKEKRKFLLDLLAEARIRDFRKKYTCDNVKLDL